MLLFVRVYLISDPLVGLQAEYDRLLAKYTETENLIGQVR